ncbi:MAG: DNA recombination/repair protein RecA [Alphaproteobacteria bacterium]
MAKSKKSEINVDERLKQLEELFGKGTIVAASSKQMEEVAEWCSTGSLTLDLATGGLGIPKGGKTTCILGKESSSKTTLALHIIAEDQKKGNRCAFCDVEGTLDLEYAKSLGVNLDLLDLVDRESLLKANGVKDRDIVSGEEWIEITCKLLKSNFYGIVVMDSVAALIPMAEITSGMAGVQIGRIAALMAKAYRAINAALSVSKSAFVYLNQYRMNPGGYGNPYIEPAGEAMKYLQALKIEITKSIDKDTDGVYGIYVKGKITKSKVCIPWKEFEYYVEFGKGIQRYKEVMELAIEKGIIGKTGNTYSFEGSKLGVGQGQLEAFLLDNTELLKEIENKVLAAIKEPIEIVDMSDLQEAELATTDYLQEVLSPKTKEADDY